MDPNATLKEIRKRAQIIIDHDDRGSVVIDLDICAELSHLIQNLDQWLSNGGFLPADWSKDR